MYHLTLIRGAELAEGVAPEAQLPEPLARFAIGRDPANPWPIPDRTRAISARHCEIVATPAGPALRDLSTNGTFVNGAPLRLQGEHLLDDGDVFELGPYAIRVSGPRRASGTAQPLPAQAAATSHVAPAPTSRTPGVFDTAPLRGGDPAAMMAAAANAQAAPWGLTEILRSSPPAADDADIDVTQIRVAPKAAVTHPAPGERSAPAPSAAASAVPAQAPAPSVAAPVPTAPTPPVESLAVAAVHTLRQLLDHQAQVRRHLGSRTPHGAALRAVANLRLPASPQAAVQALTAPGGDAAATLQCAADELVAHQDRLLAAFRTAAQRLAADLSPRALQAALGPAGNDAQKARLWDLYTHLWQTLGTAGDDGDQGLIDTALHHLALAYDASAASPLPPRDPE